MDLVGFRNLIPNDVDIRPLVADAANNYVQSKIKTDLYPSPHGWFLNQVISKTGLKHNAFTLGDGRSDPAKNKIDGWRQRNVGKRGRRALPEAVFYWFFRYAPEPSYFIQVATEVWKTDTENLKRFCYAKEGGQANDSFEMMLARFRSIDALAHDVISSDRKQRLSPTFPKAVDLKDSHQANRTEFFQAKEILLAKVSQSLPLTTAIYGAGGYGKSCLAQELCDDISIRERFPGGIYWLQFGLIDSNDESLGSVALSRAIEQMFASQYRKAQRPTLEDRDDDALEQLINVLPDKPLLLVADDLWVPAELRWLSKVPMHVVVLLTTRRDSVADTAKHKISIHALGDEASYALLTHGVPEILPHQQHRFRELANAFKGWPLILSLANGQFKKKEGASNIDEAIRKCQEFLADDDITAWDVPEYGDIGQKKRRKLVGSCVEAGLQAIHPNNSPEFLRAFGVFPDDTEIPFSVAFDFWTQLGKKKIGKIRGLTLLSHFKDFSFFSWFSEDTESLRLHDEILAHFRSSMHSGQLKSLHRELLASFRSHCDTSWDTLGRDHRYAWGRLLYHLEKADLTNEADDLRTDFGWLKAKLSAVGSLELQRSFFPMPKRRDAGRTGQAINLSTPVLTQRPESLGHQLYGRLGHESDPRLQRLAQAARSDATCCPVPVKPHLFPLGHELLRFVVGTSEVTSVAFHPNGQKIVTGAEDGTVRVWDAKTGEQANELLTENGFAIVNAIFDTSGHKILAVSDDSTARLWDAETGREIGRLLEEEDEGLAGAAFVARGLKVMTASRHGAVCLWDIGSGLQTWHVLEGYPLHLWAAAFDPSGRKVVTVANKGGAHLWDLITRSGKLLEGHTHRIVSAAFDASGSRIVTTSYDHTARLWDAETGNQIGEPLKGHGALVTCAAFDSGGLKVVTGSSDNTARVWNVASGLQIGEPLEGHHDEITCAAFDRTDLNIITGSRDSTVRIWNVVADTKVQKTPKGDDGTILCARFNQSGSRLVTGSRLGTACFWDTETGEQIGEVLRHDSMVCNVNFDNTGNRVAAGLPDGTVRLWNAETGEVIGKSLGGHLGGIRNAIFDTTGRKIVTACDDGIARLWDADKCERIARLEHGRGGIVDATFDPTGHRIATASGDGAIFLWNAKNGKRIRRLLNLDGGKFVRVVFDPNWHKIVTASLDGTMRVWNAKTGVQIGKSLEGHSNLVSSVKFDANGQKLISASTDRTVRVWNADDGNCLGVVDFDIPPLAVVWRKGDFAVALSNSVVCTFTFDRYFGASVGVQASMFGTMPIN